MAHMTVQRKTMELVAQDVITEHYRQGEFASRGWAARMRGIVGGLFQPRDNRFMDPRLNQAYEQSRAQVDAISRLIR